MVKEKLIMIESEELQSLSPEERSTTNHREIWEDYGLNPREYQFCLLYVRRGAFGVERCAREAGYTPESARCATAWLKPHSPKFRPKLFRFIQDSFQERHVTAESWGAHMGDLMQASLAGMVTKGKNDRLEFDLDKAIETGSIKAIKRIKISSHGSVDIELIDQVRLSELIGKSLGLLINRSELNISSQTLAAQFNISVDVIEGMKEAMKLEAKKQLLLLADENGGQLPDID